MNSLERSLLLSKIVSDGNDDEQLNRQLVDEHDTNRTDAIFSRYFRIFLFIVFMSVAIYEVGFISILLLTTFIFIFYEFAYFNILNENNDLKYNNKQRQVNYDSIRNEYNYYSTSYD
ncbi:MAG: hypothetical protein IMY67_09140 [Bacteroidetes bacterium]|nr:hypothetical protein [Bacteroidota bacterium]